MFLSYKTNPSFAILVQNVLEKSDEQHLDKIMHLD